MILAALAGVNSYKHADSAGAPHKTIVPVALAILVAAQTRAVSCLYAKRIQDTCDFEFGDSLKWLYPLPLGNTP